MKEPEDEKREESKVEDVPMEEDSVKGTESPEVPSPEVVYKIEDAMEATRETFIIFSTYEDSSSEYKMNKIKMNEEDYWKLIHSIKTD